MKGGGVRKEDCQRIVDALVGEDTQGQKVVYRSGKTSTFEAEWEKIADPSMTADAAWGLAVTQVQQRLLTELGISPQGVVVETPHPYEAKTHSWSREVSMDGAKSLSVHFASMCETYDSCASLDIYAGGLMKASAGVGARVQFQSFANEDDEDEIQQLRGTVRKRNADGVWMVQIDRGDLGSAESYQDILSEDVADYFAMCPDEHQSLTVEYKDGQKVADEISGFYLDRAYPLTPFRVKGFSGVGPAQKKGVQAGWFLDVCKLLSGPSRDKYLTLREDGDSEGDDAEAGDGEEDRKAEVPTDLSEVCKDPEACLRRLEELRNFSDVTLVFTNGLKSKLLPTANVTYPEGTAVGDEIEGLETCGDRLKISSFKDAGPAQEAGVRQGWCLQPQQTLRQGRQAPTKLSQEQLADTEAILQMSGVTLVFEPADVRNDPAFQGYGNWDGGCWKTCVIPGSGASVSFRTDGDGVDYPQRRWGVFALILPHESNQPAQETVDELARRWQEVSTRARGIRGSVTITPEDWDEARLRALCALHGWEFEWMTEDGERRRRIGDLQALRSAAAARGRGADQVWWRLEDAAKSLRSKLWQPGLQNNEKVEGPETIDQEGADPSLGAVNVKDLQLLSRPAREMQTI